jgi:hypothetical protein
MRPGWVGVLLVACEAGDAVAPGPGGSDAPIATPAPTTPTGSTGGIDTGLVTAPPTAAALALPAAGTVNNGRFATSDVCAPCHATDPASDALTDAAGRAIGMVDLWQGTAMANAARDPIWRAAVSAEVAATPAAADAITATCFRCHAPMASTESEGSGSPLDLATLTQPGELGSLGLDGVSCTACHQIQPDGLGTDASFSGQYVILPLATLYGPFADPFGHPMEMATGFSPAPGGQILRSDLCGSCHTLEGHALDADGRETGATVLEQATFLEWRNSDAGDADQSCQDCHLPTVDVDGRPISTEIAHPPGGGSFPMVGPRAPVGRHVLVGGNTWLPALLRDQAAFLSPAAPPSSLDGTIAAATAQLGASASVALVDLTRAASLLVGTVRVSPLTGHKLPTGIPLRRAWLHLVVTDASGREVFTSGGWDAEGRWVDAAGAIRPEEEVGGPVLAHQRAIADPDDRVAWEGVLADAAGAPTWRLTRGAGWWKDNRLLPAGWDSAHPDAPGTEPVGVADDPDFLPGSDAVDLAVPLTGAGPWTVRAEVVYQPVSARWAAELFAVQTPETAALSLWWAALDRTPLLLGSAEAVVP